MFTVRDPSVPPARGMTLLEVVVGLAILGLMAGAIHAIVSGAVESSAILAATQSEDRRLETFLNRTRSALAHLPTGATVELKVLESEPLRQEFILRGVSEAYIWGGNPRWEKPVITLSPRLREEDRSRATAAATTQPGLLAAPDRYALGLNVPDLYRVGEEGEPLPDSPIQSLQGNQFFKPDTDGRFWVPLLPEVDRVEWRVWDAGKKLWIEQKAAGRPELVELKLYLPGRITPLRAVFSTN